jgi:hypothetical protein
MIVLLVIDIITKANRVFPPHGKIRSEPVENTGNAQVIYLAPTAPMRAQTIPNSRRYDL